MELNLITKNCVIDSNGCWIWQKSCNSAGYGQLTKNKVYWLAHRYAYACRFADLTEDLVIRHQCHNKKCCNPAHLLSGSHKENWHDSADLHREMAKQRRNSWDIAGVVYSTIREANKVTGISMSSLNKYTINGVFQIEAYRAACKKAAWIPKI